MKYKFLYNIFSCIFISFASTAYAQANLNDYLDELTKSSSEGSSMSAEILGKAYYLGFISFKPPNGRTQYFTVEKDPARAFRFFKMAAAKGNYDAAALAGILVMNGDGVQQSDAEAIKYFEAAYTRNEQARYYLSHYYYQSTDLKIKQKGFDLVKTTEYLENPELLNMLAKYYENGVAVTF
jgi:TPR repeat protein